ncbi:vWA domain-containing protein [Chiayiivirga flava]|uniref:Ca-activated chloride channel family protein n=1 Tax=Chiayiivirga flava TaxID=659595 RepID=A0A7W8G0D1_9GAMM|nr:VWA domain-containing protein [Chiayiivirga flava]MBB5206645.1 Ca-activated chloride channel family protein [Chiayiivirga flava]
MHRLSPLTAAIVLTLLAGCSTSSPDQTQSRVRPEPDAVAQASAKAERTQEVLAEEQAPLDSITVTGSRIARRDTAMHVVGGTAPMSVAAAAPPPPMRAQPGVVEPANRETYADIASNPIHRAAEEPVSTFSIDVDSGSYANVRRMLVQGRLPPSDAVRSEEFLNYFDYGYAPPASPATPFSVTTEFAVAPWNPQRHLLLVGLKGYEVPASAIPASNLVFLIDTSGSMQSPDKIDLLKQAFAELTQSLRPQDRVAIVAYAGSAGLVLDSTAGSDKATILAAIDRLQAGGSTNGGAGIELAYATAQAHLIAGGVNRVILATDGDFNVGTVSQDALETLVKHKRDSGIALTTLGFGQGNYNDQLAERLADIGNGNHAYIDTPNEARKVLVEELSSTMMTIARDVKIQIEFNPAVVAEYRLVGYENRLLAREDFNNDKVDAGEIGAGHDVTALYEIAVVGSGGEASEPLRYAAPVAGGTGDELGFLRLRYKAPDGDTSKLIETPLSRTVEYAPSERLRFAAAVAAFSDALRDGAHLGRWTFDDIAAAARGGADPFGYRAEFVALVQQAKALKAGSTPVAIAD